MAGQGIPFQIAENLPGSTYWCGSPYPGNAENTQPAARGSGPAPSGSERAGFCRQPCLGQQTNQEMYGGQIQRQK